MGKQFKIAGSEIRRLVPDLGYAFASDMILVQGKKVDWMERHEPEREEDSGWMFYGGGETQEYLDDPKHVSLVEVNTVVNYDPGIVTFLTYPPGSVFERNARGELELMTKDVEKPEVVLMLPVDAGRVAITRNWSFEVGSHMLRRVDRGSMVIWKPGFTIWLDVYTSEAVPVGEKVEAILENRSPDAYDVQQEEKAGFVKVRYTLVETGEDGPQKSVCLFGLAETSDLQMAVYFNEDAATAEIDTIWRTMAYVKG